MDYKTSMVMGIFPWG